MQLPGRSVSLTGILHDRLAREGTLVLKVKVIPRAAKSEIVSLLENGDLKVKIAAVPEKGRANQELQRLLAGYFDVPRSNVQLLAGETSSRKRVKINRS